MQFNFNTIKDFYTDNITNEVTRKTFLTIGIFTAVIFSQVILHGFVEIVDGIPVFNSLMQVVGVYATARFVLQNLATKSQRDDFAKNIQDTYKDIVG